MPVKAVGRKLIEVATGKVVGTCKTEKSCKIAAALRNAALKGPRHVAALKRKLGIKK